MIKKKRRGKYPRYSAFYIGGSSRIPGLGEYISFGSSTINSNLLFYTKYFNSCNCSKLKDTILTNWIIVDQDLRNLLIKEAVNFDDEKIPSNIITTYYCFIKPEDITTCDIDIASITHVASNGSILYLANSGDLLVSLDSKKTKDEKGILEKIKNFFKKLFSWGD